MTNIKNKNCLSCSHKGFTLAETLITLVVVGIVAALTVPALVNKYNRTLVETRLKQANSMLANMIRFAEADHGSMSKWDLSNLDDQEFFPNTYMVPYLKYRGKPGRKKIKDVGYKDGIVYPDGTVFLPSDLSPFIIDLDNGARILISITYTVMAHKTLFKYLTIWVDINGFKGPNRLAKDIFTFQQPLLDGYPMVMLGEYQQKTCLYTGTIDMDYVNQNKCTYMFNTDTKDLTFFPGFKKTKEELMESCKIYYNARECGALIKLNNWKIPDDYPWL